MKIKKPSSASSSSSQGGAAIANRFKLDMPNQGVANGASAKNGVVGKKSATLALIAASISLAVAGVLTYMLYQHWQYLMPA